ncbi:MAG TPA: hypothetical protein VMA32_08430 [Streptosporangiaceae bacterium]|nr:hypothetical protein [Streptosporangiaceae bacterium]
MLKFPPATAKPGSDAAEAGAAQAALRPLAGFGAGAFGSDGVWAGSHASQKVASPALPRFRGASAGATSQECAQAPAHGGAYEPGFGGRTSSIRIRPVGSAVGTQQISLMARLNPVTPGGVGPHPAREPRPV